MSEAAKGTLASAPFPLLAKNTGPLDPKIFLVMAAGFVAIWLHYLYRKHMTRPPDDGDA